MACKNKRNLPVIPAESLVKGKVYMANMGTFEPERGSLLRAHDFKHGQVLGLVSHGDSVIYLERDPRMEPWLALKVIHGENVGWFRGWLSEFDEEG